MTIWSKLSLIIVGTSEDTCCSVVLPLCRPKMRGARLWDLRSGCLRVNQLIERYWLSLPLLWSLLCCLGPGGWLDILFIQMFPEIMKDKWVAWLLGALSSTTGSVKLLYWNEVFSVTSASLLHRANRRAWRVLRAQDFWKTSRVKQRRRRRKMRDDDGCWHLVTI